LVSNPEFIIADEPTGNLDPQTAKQIADLLIELNNQGNTVLFITHDMNLVTYLRNKSNKIREVNISE
jgi:cell division transport system ATP-binding protein